MRVTRESVTTVLLSEADVRFALEAFIYSAVAGISRSDNPKIEIEIFIMGDVGTSGHTNPIGLTIIEPESKS